MSTGNSINIDVFKKMFGEAVRNIRRAKGMTQEEFCEKFGLKTAANLSAIENGKSLVTLDALIRICRGCDISADSLLFQQDRTAVDDATIRIIAEYKQVLKELEKHLQEDLQEAKDRHSQIGREVQSISSGIMHTDPRYAESRIEIHHMLQSYINTVEKLLDGTHSRQEDLERDKGIILRSLYVRLEKTPPPDPNKENESS